MEKLKCWLQNNGPFPEPDQHLSRGQFFLRNAAVKTKTPSRAGSFDRFLESKMPKQQTAVVWFPRVTVMCSLQTKNEKAQIWQAASPRQRSIHEPLCMKSWRPRVAGQSKGSIKKTKKTTTVLQFNRLEMYASSRQSSIAPACFSPPCENLAASSLQTMSAGWLR